MKDLCHLCVSAISALLLLVKFDGDFERRGRRDRRDPSSPILHPSSLILHPSSFIPIYSPSTVNTAISGGTRKRIGRMLVPIPVVTNIVFPFSLTIPAANLFP
jgi:hypothetical protein